MVKKTDADWKALGANHYSILVRRIIVGYYRSYATGKWRVYQIVGENYNVIGLFDTPELARKAADEAIIRLLEEES